MSIRRIVALLGVVLIFMSGIAAAAPVLGSDVAKALASSRVRDRDAAITALTAAVSEDNEQLLNALLDGRILYDAKTSEVFLLENAGAAEAVSLTDGHVQPKTGLRKSAISTPQKKRISEALNAYAFGSPDRDKRLNAVSALLEPGAKLISLNDVDALLAHEDDAAVYERLQIARALILAAAPEQVGTQEMLRAIDVLEDYGNTACRQALDGLTSRANPEVAKAASSAVSYLNFTTAAADFVETLFFGLSLGSIFVLIGIGLAITFGVMGVINMAHGEMIMLGAYTVWGLQQLLPGSPGLALRLAIPGSFVVSGAVGILLERTVIRHLYGRALETLLATFGISLILQQAVRSIFSPLNRAVVTPDFMQGALQISTNLSITWIRIYIIVFCLIVFFLILAVMQKTRLGLEVRAVSQNRAIARALGIRSARVDAMTFGLGSGVAGMAGVALSQITNVGPNLGQSYIIDSFMVVVFGGVGNLWGTLTSGLILGVANKFLEPVSGAMLSKIIILIAIILFIQKRPRGLFPQRGRAVED